MLHIQKCFIEIQVQLVIILKDWINVMMNNKQELNQMIFLMQKIINYL